MVKACRKAAKVLIRDFGEIEKLQVSLKGPGDFVSAADKKVEKIIIDELAIARPNYSILSEEVGEINNEFVEGFYLSDGYINLAILNFKTEALAGEEYGTKFSGLHHIGFQVEDSEAADIQLKKAGSAPRDDINSAFKSQMGKGHGGKNSEMKYTAPDNVLIDISQDGWVGT